MLQIMSKFRVVGLTSQEVIDGKLYLAMDLINQTFSNSVKAVAEKRMKPQNQERAIINFGNPLEGIFYEKYKDKYQVILYLNEAAQRITDNGGVHLEIIDKVEEIPKDAGVAISMPVLS